MNLIFRIKLSSIERWQGVSAENSEGPNKLMPYNIMDIADKDKRIPTPRALLFESFRLKSFYNFPGRKPDYGVKPYYRTLAKRGFYYDRLSNEVICYFCQFVLTEIDNYSEPLTHARNCGCKMFIYPLNGNVPLIETESDPEDSLNRINDLLQRFVTNGDIYKVINKNTVIDFDGRLARNNLELEFPEVTHSNDFSNYEVRLSTYDPWFSYLPENQKPNKELFAKAGFVYTDID
ncbi:hypothetical protein Avbf_13181 [Armadillidium vulgare]|nr:hypothetical protein Avbf_13181 [Armadillidium vulgare]